MKKRTVVRVWCACECMIVTTVRMRESVVCTCVCLVTLYLLAILILKMSCRSLLFQERTAEWWCVVSV